MYISTFLPPLQVNLTVTIPTTMAPLCTVYLEDLHKHVFIVIFSAVESIIVSIPEKMLWSVVKLLGYIFSWQKIVDDIYLIKITEIMRNTDPKKLTSDSVCYDNKFWNYNR